MRRHSKTRAGRATAGRRGGLRTLTLAAWLLAVIAGASCAPAGSLDREPLTPRQLSTPEFDPPPPKPSAGDAISQIAADAKGGAGYNLLMQLVPTQGAALWISLIVMLVVAIDFRRPLNSRNIELLALLPIGILLFEVMRFFELFRDPVYRELMDWGFTGIMAVSLFLLSRAVWRAGRPHSEPWRPSLDGRALMALTLVLLAANLMAGLLRVPDDVGFYTNLGAQRLRETGMFPYGDPMLSGTPGATYSPIFYLSHLAYQLVLLPNTLNAAEPLPAFGVYLLPPDLASRLATVTFHLIGVAGLIVAARRLVGREAAWGVAALYCGSAYVMGVGGERELIGGMTFLSHIGPAAITMLAFAALPFPVLSGALLATGVATLFYPAFFIPAWLGYYSTSRPALVRFVAGLALATVVIGVPVLMRSKPIEGRGLISSILHETQGHQQDPKAYGSSPFGFWGQRQGVRATLREPLVAGQPNTSPAFLVFALFVIATFFLARGRTEVPLALLTGALGIGSQLWKIHATGVYVTWYLGFLLLGFLGHQLKTSQSRAS